jgi:uncharacterized membrane protein
MRANNSLAIQHKVLSLSNRRAYLFETLFIILAVALPAICHLIGAPVRFLLPMHWTVVLAGLVYGWKGGAISGLLSPALSFFITGMPYPPMIFPMTAELFTYGAITGLARERLNLNAFTSIAIALISGRIIYIFTFLIFSGGLNIPGYLESALLPGIVAGVLQIILIPFAAKFWKK